MSRRAPESPSEGAREALARPFSMGMTLSGDVNELSPNKRLHYMDRARRVKRWREAARQSALTAYCPVKFTKARVSFYVRRGRRVDEDNIAGSGVLKAIVDGLVDAGWFPDDSPRYVVRGEVVQQPSKEHRHRPHVMLFVEEID